MVATVVAPPADARADPPCRDRAGFWCLYGKPGLQDGGGLIGTNNGDTDLKMNEDWTFFNDATRSVSNKSGSYLGLYNDIEFKGLMACLPPSSSMARIGAGVSSLRVHPSKAAACTTRAKTEQPNRGPVADPKPRHSATPSARPRKSEDLASVSPSIAPTKQPGQALPSLDAPAPQLPSAPPPVNTAKTKPTAGESSGIAWGPVAAIAAGVFALLVLGISGLILGRRHRHEKTAATPAPRTATDPEAAARVHRALLLLAIDCEQEQRDVPKARAVTIDAKDVSLHLAARDEAPPQPWRADSGGRRWYLPAADIDELTDDVSPEFPYPLLAALRPGVWANLGALPGPVALAGNRKAARKAAIEMARRLREDPWHLSVRVRMVGFPPDESVEPEGGTELGRVVFIDDSMKVPDKAPPGSAVVAVGEPDGAGTVWQVRYDGSITMPGNLLAKRSDDSAPAPADSAASAAAGGK